MSMTFEDWEIWKAEAEIGSAELRKWRFNREWRNRRRAQVSYLESLG
jgi:hypothetical protein